ncbi:inter-alpha-trypsin inhibitor heavy chain H3-like isoform X8 [Anguilla anguilla]|uniref:inter-alpha-trypsin inhibitor heavy chain H3-like isoform X8 n=1 Tax=Anguilla anguilla TaxID=7936 RepID=UPI0015B1DB8B|nr:inter-alpha-trypsin inhibitor heavy chain H3-like isoform X8 [Anguilla anguilla]
MLPHAVLLLCLLLASTSASPVRRDTESTQASPGKKKDLDIYSFHIKSAVSSRYAMTVITSRVANRANKSQEVLFHVELPKNAFISKFSMNMDGRVYDGVVKKKEEAQSQYTEAVSRGQSAGLVSAVGRTLEEFQTSVTVAAHSKVTFELTYEELLKRRLGQYELLIKARPTQVVKDFKIEVRVFEQQGIAFLKTQGSLIAEGRSSALNTTVSEKEALVQFTPSLEQQCPSCGDAGLNGDLLLTYDVNRPQSKGEIQVSRGYFVHYFAPTGLPRIPKNVVFIIDQSGSMHGRKIEQTREALLKILGDIPEEDHFGLITFDNQVFPWKTDLVPATSDYLSAARTFVKGIMDRGSTDINEALLQGVQMLNRFKETHPQKDTASILILLTDGDPTSGVTNLKQIQTNVKEAIGKKYTLYCLGFGFDVNYEFLEKMALENEGVARRIYSDSDAALQLQGFYEEVATPLLLNIRLNYTGVSNLTQTQFAQYYNGSEIVVCGLVTDNDLEALTAEVKANTKDEAVVFRATLEDQKAMSEIMDLYIFEMYIQRLWAYLTVQQHLEKMLLLTGDEKSHMKEQALALALKYSFVTPLTSMVVTKPEGEQQVAHKPKEGKEGQGGSVLNQRISGPIGSHHAYLGRPLHHPGLGSRPGQKGSSGQRVFIGLSAHPASFSVPSECFALIGLPAPPGPPGPPGLFASQMGYLDRPDYGIRYLLMEPDDISDTVPAATVVSPQKFRFLLPALSYGPLTSPRPDIICFDLDVQGEPIFRLMEDRPAELVITGQVRGTGQKGFSAISLRMGQAWHMQVNTTTITLGTDQYSWTHKNSAIVDKDSVWIHHTDRLLDMRWAEVSIKILLHQEGGDYFLWPDITGSTKIFTGLIGWLQGGHVEKHTAPMSADLHIQGLVVPASRDTAVDYRILSMPTVDCWLFQYRSVLQGNLSHLMLPTL